MEPIPPLVSYSELIVIVLTALAVLLTALAIIIGIAAIWDWAGIKEAAEKSVNLKMKELQPERMLELASRMEDVLGSWDAIQSKVVTDRDTKGVAPASNTGVQQGTVVAPPYPGEGVQNASSTADSTRNTSENSGQVSRYSPRGCIRSCERVGIKCLGYAFSRAEYFR